MPHQPKQKHTTKKERKAAAEEAQRKEAEAALAVKRTEVEKRVAEALEERRRAEEEEEKKNEEFEEGFEVIGSGNIDVVENTYSANATVQPVVIGKAGSTWGSWLWPFGGGSEI